MAFNNSCYECFNITGWLVLQRHEIAIFLCKIIFNSWLMAFWRIAVFLNLIHYKLFYSHLIAKDIIYCYTKLTDHLHIFWQTYSIKVCYIAKCLSNWLLPEAKLFNKRFYVLEHISTHFYFVRMFSIAVFGPFELLIKNYSKRV